MDILSELNAQQRLAVEHDLGPLLILAGAGSGKTKTLTHRIAYLVKERGISPEQILAVTFTNKAAREMRDRLWGLLEHDIAISGSLPPRGFMPWMGTFHSICVRLLRQDGQSLGISRYFVIYDEDDKVSAIKQAIKKLNLADQDVKPRTVASIISKSKNDLLKAKDFADSATTPWQRKVAKIYKEYEKQISLAGALDFDDLLIKTVELLRSNELIRQKWREQFKYILIDEYQDTNAVQYALIRLLVNQQENICVVGDDSQSIYSFRGADYTNILNFEKDFPGTTVIKLEQNYRSTGAILELANELIQHNVRRTDKKLWTSVEGGVEPKLVRVYSDGEEGANIAQEVWRQATVLGRGYDDMAVLYRTNAQSYAIERALRERGIPFKIVGGLRFLDRAVVKDIIAYLRLLYQPSDRISFLRIANVPKRGIGAVSLQRFLTWLDELELSVIDGLLRVEEAASVPKKARTALYGLGLILEKLQQGLDGSPAELLEEIISRTGYDNYINDGSVQAEERLENIGVLLAEARAYADVASFLEEMALMSSSDDQAEEQVTLMTLHSAKGLEFPVVFLAGLEEGLLPHARVFDSGKSDDIEEERRLCYVGITRAREELFITCASSRYQFGQVGYNPPSRFLSEMGLFAGETDLPASAEYIEEEFYDDGIGIEPGDRVSSPAFGEGEVIEVDGLAVYVRFDSGKTRQLNVEFARLKKL